MEATWFYIVWIVGAYLVGSASIGDLVCRAAGVDIRAVGSCNPGTSNIFREVGKTWGVAVFLLDITKGATVTVPLYLLGLESWVRLLATVALLTGQFFPIFWRFRGGTGMAACFGTTAGLLPIGALIGAPIAFVALKVSRNIGWSGGLFLLVTVVAGGLIMRDAMAILAVGLGGGAVFVRAAVQYRNAPPPEERVPGPARARQMANDRGRALKT